MAAMNVESLQAKLQSARKSILFMETEHAKTLHGLHHEIQHLKKKCTELTFNLAMKEEENISDKVREKLRALELEADVSTQEKVSLTQQIEQKDRQLIDLEEKAKLQERKYLNELKSKNHQLSGLANELDSRASTIAYLTTQLHQAHTKLHQLAAQPPQQQPSRYAPAPPTANRPKSGSEPASARPTSSSRRARSRPSSHSLSAASMPDPAPFLAAGLSAFEGDSRQPPKPPSVLPPIARPDSADGKSRLPYRAKKAFAIATPLKACNTPDQPTVGNSSHHRKV